MTTRARHSVGTSEVYERWWARVQSPILLGARSVITVDG
jgi:hypothetical protein